MQSIQTYTADMTRPHCPDCGAPIQVPPHVLSDPARNAEAWPGECAAGHAFTYQLDQQEE